MATILSTDYHNRKSHTWKKSKDTNRDNFLIILYLKACHSSHSNSNSNPYGPSQLPNSSHNNSSISTPNLWPNNLNNMKSTQLLSLPLPSGLNQIQMFFILLQKMKTFSIQKFGLPQVIQLKALVCGLLHLCRLNVNVLLPIHMLSKHQMSTIHTLSKCLTISLGQ